MQYLLMIHADEKAVGNQSKEDLSNMMAAYAAYTTAMSEAGVKIASDRLQPTSTATTVRVKNGKTQVLNGPYAEVKEQLGGYYAIEAPDLDAAISWAARCPGAQHGAIEVRPIWKM
ncbi:MAG: YciI family protein [Roseiarcus sp.]